MTWLSDVWADVLLSDVRGDVLFQMEVEALRRDLHMTRLALCNQVSFQCSGGRHGDRPDDAVSTD